MEWSAENNLALISVYKEHKCLWDPTSPNYKITNIKNDAWKSIAKVFKTETYEVKKKMNSLLTSFRRERSKENEKKSGSGANDTYKSSWFAYSEMAFLLDKFKPKNTVDVGFSKPAEPTNEQSFEKEAEPDNGGVESFESGSPFQEHVKKSFKSPKKVAVKRKSNAINPMVEDAYKILKESVEKTDDCSIFGELIAHKLRSYSRKTKILAQYKINNIIFEADMGHYDVDNTNNLPSISLMLSPATTIEHNSPRNWTCTSEEPTSGSAETVLQETLTIQQCRLPSSNATKTTAIDLSSNNSSEEQRVLHSHDSGNNLLQLSTEPSSQEAGHLSRECISDESAEEFTSQLPSNNNALGASTSGTVEAVLKQPLTTQQWRVLSTYGTLSTATDFSSNNSSEEQRVLHSHDSGNNLLQLSTEPSSQEAGHLSRECISDESAEEFTSQLFSNDNDVQISAAQYFSQSIQNF